MNKILTLGTMLLAVAAQATLVNHFTFDDPDDLLKATVGDDATEYWNQKADPDGDAEGSTMATPEAAKLYAVAGEGQVSSGAVAVPRYSSLGFTHGITDPLNYCVEMRCYLPDEGTTEAYHAFMSVSQDNDSDAMLFRKAATKMLGSVTYSLYYNTYLPTQQWHTVSISCKNGTQTIYLDGSKMSIATSAKGALTDLTKLFFGMDNDGEDALIYFDEIKVYDVAEPKELRDPRYATGQREITAISQTATTITLTLGAGTRDLLLVQAYGADDAGETIKNWDTIEPVRIVHANESSVDVPIPDGWGVATQAVRYFFFAPDGFPVECYTYVKSTDSGKNGNTKQQYLNTGITACPKTDYRVEGSLSSVATQTRIFGARKVHNSSYLFINAYINGNSKPGLVCLDYTGQTVSGVQVVNTVVNSNKHTWRINVNGGNTYYAPYYDGSNGGASTAGFKTTRTLCGCGPLVAMSGGNDLWGSGNASGYGKLYKVDVLQSSTYIRAFHPAKGYNANGELVAGMFEEINGKFYPSAGNENFSVDASAKTVMGNNSDRTSIQYVMPYAVSASVTPTLAEPIVSFNGDLSLVADDTRTVNVPYSVAPAGGDFDLYVRYTISGAADTNEAKVATISAATTDVGTIADLKPCETYDIALFARDGGTTYDPTEFRSIAIPGPATNLVVSSVKSYPDKFVVSGTLTPGLGTTTLTLDYAFNQDDPLDQTMSKTFSISDEGVYSFEIPVENYGDKLYYSLSLSNNFNSVTYGDYDWSNDPVAGSRVMGDTTLTTYTWKGGTSGDWTNKTNWTSSPAGGFGFPDGNNAKVAIPSTWTDVAINLGGRSFTTYLDDNGSGGITLNNSGTLTLSNGTFRTSYQAFGTGGKGCKIRLVDCKLTSKSSGGSEAGSVFFTQNTSNHKYLYLDGGAEVATRFFSFWYTASDNAYNNYVCSTGTNKVTSGSLYIRGGFTYIQVRDGKLTLPTIKLANNTLGLMVSNATINASTAGFGPNDNNTRYMPFDIFVPKAGFTEAPINLGVSTLATLESSKVPNFHPSMKLRFESEAPLGWFPLITGVADISMTELNNRLTVVPAKMKDRVKLRFVNNTISAKVSPRGTMLLVQ